MSPLDSPLRTPLSLWRNQQLKALVPVLVLPAVTILLLVLANMSYLFGGTFEQSKRIHALKILAVDLDGGAVGSAIIRASENFQAANFPTIDIGSASEYPTPAAVREAVCRGDYWGAVHVHQGASEKLASVLGGSASTAYNASNGVTYIYNQARYPTVADPVLGANMQKVVAASRGFYYQSANGATALRSLNASNPGAVAAFLNPIASTPEIIGPQTQADRAFFNTLNFIIPTLAQFFYLLSLNEGSVRCGLLVDVRVRDVYLLRLAVTKLYCLLTAITVTGYLWAFRENWPVGGSEFGLTVLVFWLYLDAQWQVLETLIGSFLPMPAVPFFFLTWIILNVASTIFPFEIMPGFYRVGYALPAHSAYSLLVKAWSGCADQTSVALPVLFTWWLVGHVTSVFSIRKRCANAREAALDIAKTLELRESVSMSPRNASAERPPMRNEGPGEMEKSIQGSGASPYRN